jgi:acyl-CoA reductase-like NAD-dependent aldehyde dehydrogenase
VSARRAAKAAPAPRERVRVAKAYKMFVGGAFVRSESGRTEPVGGVRGADGADPRVVNVPRASRKDARDAVVVARAAADAWAGRSAYNRGQILYRLAEVMESRRDELRGSILRGGESGASREVDVAVDRAVYYAGFCDKFQALVASHNPVAGPHFGFSVPEPMGVVAIVAPARPSLLGLVSVVLPVIAGGNTCVVVAGRDDPRTAVLWSECLATSDLPAGVVNVLTGDAAEIAPHLARHREVAALDAWSADADLLAALERDASGSVKRVRTHDGADASRIETDAGQGLGFLEAFLETKTVWHPVGT